MMQPNYRARRCTERRRGRIAPAWRPVRDLAWVALWRGCRRAAAGLLPAPGMPMARASKGQGVESASLLAAVPPRGCRWRRSVGTLPVLLRLGVGLRGCISDRCVPCWSPVGLCARQDVWRKQAAGAGSGLPISWALCPSPARGRCSRANPDQKPAKHSQEYAPYKAGDQAISVVTNAHADAAHYGDPGYCCDQDLVIHGRPSCFAWYCSLMASSRTLRASAQRVRAALNWLAALVRSLEMAL